MRNRINEVIKHPLFTGSLIMVIGSNLVNFFNLLYHFVLGRMLGPGGYGELAAIISLIGLLGIIPVSLGLAVTKYASTAKNNTEVSAFIYWLRTKALIISLLLSLIILAISPVILSFLHIDRVFYLVLVVIVFFFSIHSQINRSVLQGLLKFKEMVISTLSDNSFKLLISTLLVYFGFGVGGAMAGLALSAVLGWYITAYFLSYYKERTKIKINFKPVLSFTGPVLIQSIAVTSLYSSDVILVKHFFSPYDAGVYAALSTLGKIIFFGAGPISGVMFPLISRGYSQGGEYRKVFIYSLLATLLLAVFVLTTYWLMPEFVISLLYGSSYIAAADLLIWFGIFIALFTLSSLMINFHLSLGHKRVVLIPAAAAVLQIVAIWLYHEDLLSVIIISILVAALLLGLLLIYSSYEKGKPEDKQTIFSPDKTDISNSSGL